MIGQNESLRHYYYISHRKLLHIYILLIFVLNVRLKHLNEANK